MEHRTAIFELRKASPTDHGGTKTYPAVLSTDAPVERADGYGGRYLEVLSHEPSAIDLSRAPLPLLESHGAGALPVGVVEDIHLAAGKLRGEVRFSTSQRGQEIQADVEAGILRSLSVGYAVLASEKSKPASNEPLIITATRWVPYEASAVAIPADSGAGFNRSKEILMEPITVLPNTTTAPDIVLAERTRVVEIHRLAALADFDGATTGDLVTRGATVEETRGVVLEAIATRSKAETGGPRGAVAGAEGPRDHRERIVSDLIGRKMGIVEAARLCVPGGHLAGPVKLMQRALATADFANLLANVSGRTLRNGYESEPASHRTWCSAVAVKDFRLQTRPILSAAPNLAAVAEGAEYTYGSLTDDAASYAVTKYGRMVGITFEALTNDDLDSFLRILPGLGQSARRAEADAVYTLLTSGAGVGPTMQDSVVLFHATHANITATGTFNAALLAAGRALLRKQTGPGGVGHLSLVPRVLLVSPDEEHDAELLLAAASRLTAGGVDAAVPSWMTSIQLAVEPRLDGSAAYLIAGPQQVDCCELGLLEENFAGPTLEEETAFDTDVVRYKCRHVFGTKFLDYRGIVRMPIT